MRLEYKYLIPNAVLSGLRKDLLPFMDHDTHTSVSRQDYTVRSIYFDNRKLDYYYEKIEGLKIRKKLRIRGYDFAEGKNLIFLEIKRKHENFIFKNRSPLYYEELSRLFKTGDIEKFIPVDYKDEKSVPDGKRFFYHLINKSLRPIVLVTYDREAYMCKFDSRLRITFDKNLRYLPFPSLSDLYLDEHLNKALINSSIIEIKFKHSIPHWLQNIIIKYKLSRSALSKYVICLDDYAKHRPLNNSVRAAFTNREHLFKTGI